MTRSTARKPRLSRRERERIARREAIVDAAEQLVVDTGYWEMSMDAVARRAELSKGALYLYFDNKDALCAEIALRHMSELLPRLEAAAAAQTTGLQKLRSLLSLYAEWFDEQPHMYRFAISWNIPGQRLEPDSESFRKYRKCVGDVTALGIDATLLGQEDGTIRKGLDPYLTSVQLWTSFLGVYMAHMGGENFSQRLPFPIDMDAIIPFHIDQCLRAIAGPAAASWFDGEQPPPPSVTPEDPS